jgi:hypothetical protein
MMQEPTYEYVKGSGWVVMSNPITKTRCGKMVRLEYRLPEVGEHYDFFAYDHDSYFTEDKQPIWEGWTKQVRSYRYSDFSHRLPDDGDDYFQNEKWGYVVLVPV